MRYIKSITLGLVLALLGNCICYGKATFKPSVIENAKRSVVSVGVRVALTAYTFPRRFHGSGVIIDKEAGYILTSSIFVGPGLVADYIITCCNGVEAPAKLIYYDSWADFSLLKIDPSLLPKEVRAVKLSSKSPLLGQAVFTIAKEKSNQPIVYTGSIDDTNYSCVWSMPQHFMGISMPSTTNAHGSLIFNEAGEGIALNCCGADTRDFGLHLAYVRHALAALKQKKLPVRKHIGALLTTYPLEDAIQYDHLEEASQKAYLAKFPNAKNKILQVESILQGTPAMGKLYPGDLIWALNGELVGPNLVDFDMALTKSPKDELLLTIFRNGSFHEFSIPCYDLNSHRITKMVQFGGTTFFETDDFSSRLAGISPKTLASCIAESNTIFGVEHFPHSNYKFLGIQCLAINGQPVQTLDALIEQIPRLVHQKYFTIEYINYLVPLQYGMFSLFAHGRYKLNIKYDPNLAPPKVWTWDPINFEWKGKAIVLE